MMMMMMKIIIVLQKLHGLQAFLWP